MGDCLVGRLGRVLDWQSDGPNSIPPAGNRLTHYSTHVMLCEKVSTINYMVYGLFFRNIGELGNSPGWHETGRGEKRERQ